MLANFVGILFDGLAYGSLLFLISVGLSVTMGLMNFVNLAHGAFAMLGGYLCVALMRDAGVPFLATLPVVFVIIGALGAGLEVTLYRRLYRASHLDQVLFSIGLTFVLVAAATYNWGPSQQPVHLPDFLSGQITVGDVKLGVYRLFLVALVIACTGGLHFLFTKTKFGARIRASVDNQTVAAGMGVNVNRVFILTFALGAGLAGMGGAVGINVLGLDPTFPIKYMVYFLLVVTVGGAGGIRGPVIAALLLGVFDIAGKYYVPELGAFIIYGMMVVLLLAFPNGLGGRRA